MLRACLIVGSVIVLVAVAALVVLGHSVPGLAAAGVWAVILLASALFEQRRYKRLLEAPPGADWAATNERFIDPATGAEVVVYFNPKTGGRSYVRSGKAPT